MGNSINKVSKPLPIDTTFKFPTTLPTWPPGGGFASGVIDLGGLQVCQVSSFTKIWPANEGGPGNLGATFFEPSSLPEGFFMLGCYCQPNNKPLFGWVLAGKDVTAQQSNGALKQPIDYALVWSSASSKIKQDGNGYIWLPTPPEGYKAIGHVVTNSAAKPSLDKIRCVRADLTDVCEAEAWIWGPGEEVNADEFNVFGLRPTNRGTQARGVSANTFVAQNGIEAANALACLKNTNANLSNSMPNLSQVEALFQAYSPQIYLHPDEQYLPSSVSWYFQKGALLYKKGEESSPQAIEPTGSNLPQDGSNDDAYWLDLPVDEAAKELVKKGDLQEASAYLHIKPMFGGTFTDIATWVFYPFNGPGRAKVGPINIPLGEIGEHVGDWEHMTLRISNFNGELKSVYFSEHSGGTWVSAPEVEFQKGNKVVGYAALKGHAFYPTAGLVLQGTGDIGIRNDTARSEKVMDSGARFAVVAAEYLGEGIVEPAWLNYARKWGPKISYATADEVKRLQNRLPANLKTAFGHFIERLPHELLGEEGPTGPKMKNNWSGDEKA